MISKTLAEFLQTPKTAFLAERKGFEPLNGFIRYTISNRAPSTSSAIFPNSFYIIA